MRETCVPTAQSKKSKAAGLVGRIDSVAWIQIWTDFPTLTIGGFPTQMGLQMPSLKMKLSGMIQTMMAMVITSNISMEKLGGLLGEEMAVLLQKATLPWIDGVVLILTEMVGQTLLLTG